MSELLPPNANDQERALDDCLARVGAVPVEIAKLWNADTCPLAFLPWLGWALSVDEWDETWTEAQKRGAVAASYDVHSHKGTPFSIIRALVAIGYSNVEIREGDLIFYNGLRNFDGTWRYGSDGFWPQFDILLNVGYVPNANEILKIRDRVERYKNARSQFRNLIFMNLFYDGTWNFDGTNNFNGGVI